MPYIKKDARKDLDPLITPVSRKVSGAGELNFVITRLAQDFIQKQGRDYNSINAVVGVLEAAKLEFYRRLAAPYEDEKIAHNGDVYL